MSFEWDPKKARANQRKHGVTFEEASSVLRDQLSATGHDPDHSEDELRPEYSRSDFGELVRGKYANRIKEESNVVLLEPNIA